MHLIPAPFAPIPTADDPNSSWWCYIQSDSLLANVLPALPQPFIASTPHLQFLPVEKYKDKGTLVPNILLTIMNTNIKMLKWVRRMHAKFTTLNLNVEEGGMGDELPDIGEDGRVDEVKGSVELEVSEKNVDECLKWMNRKEIILHTLFESGIAKIQDLELYIKDNVIRHGSRLINLEKKLVGVYRKAVELINNGTLFAGEDYEGDNSAFVVGGFYDSLGDDFLGSQELGVTAELGLSSLIILKKPLKGKSRGTAGGVS
ncbi:hypothetical protein EV424DRAFT_1531672 [Suillus variegatus]|nr:hypothetical protein EV424DRAFT_1531672 [Suillus variegatus]